MYCYLFITVNVLSFKVIVGVQLGSRILGQWQIC